MNWQNEKLRGQLKVTSLSGPSDTAQFTDRLCETYCPVALESTAVDKDYGQFSIFATNPLEFLEIRKGWLLNRNGDFVAKGSEQIWDSLDKAFTCVELRNASEAAQLPYAPGWIGYLGYEVGQIVEKLPAAAPRDTSLPDMRLGFYDAVLVFDNIAKTWTLIELQFDDPPDHAGKSASMLREILTQNMANHINGGNSHNHCVKLTPRDTKNPKITDCTERLSNFTPDEYRAAVAKCVEYIAAGDIFQVNLSQRFEIQNSRTPADIYRSLRKRNPAWYSGYMHFNSGSHNCAIICSSPELFLRTRGRKVTTRPIKGTRPRIGDDKRDIAAANELCASEKDNAELTMIIDLLRNDLGRVCEFGSVHVTDPCRLETHPTVYHLVGTVEGQLRESVSQAELLRATFPGGSITGAPKIRAMEIIDELETAARGVYTGCIGAVGVNGSSEWNIVIRTIVCDDDRAFVQVGGGIVADSTPEGEYRETLDKARAMLEAIDMTPLALTPDSIFASTPVKKPTTTSPQPQLR
ncbi:MAG: aminodeoxychorismate synthase component I [Phycisphaerae bacterium]|nr:aminodeoxychorismate synthase component I [Phycisphaerae bacterium]